VYVLGISYSSLDSEFIDLSYMQWVPAVVVTVAVAIGVGTAFSLTSLGYFEHFTSTRNTETVSPTNAPPMAEKADDSTRDSLTMKGYVMVSVVRDSKEIYHYEDHNLITDAGKDFISAQIGSASASANGANYVALSSDSTAPAATDTSLAGEISGNGLDRSQGTYSHTLGTNTFTVTEVFSATGAANNIQKSGLFTAASSGTMLAENTFSSVNLISGDQLTITWTITIG
jgi:hypothetical protein